MCDDGDQKTASLTPLKTLWSAQRGEDGVVAQFGEVRDSVDKGTTRSLSRPWVASIHSRPLQKSMASFTLWLRRQYRL